MNFKALMLILLTVVCAYNLFLQIISYLSKNNPTPENVKDLYDAETYKKWRAYHGETSRIGILSTLASFVLYFAVIALNVLPKVGTSPNPYVSMICVVLLFFTLDALVSGVFSYIYTMKIDEKYGFNKSTMKTFLLDQVKSYIVSLVICMGLTSLLILIYEHMGDWVLVLFSGIMVAFLFIVMFLYPFFSRLYNKFTPLEEGELKDKLTALLEKNGYKVRAIQVMDASKRTTRSNAYFSGYGKTKTIVLFDTLIAAMTPDEIVAVFAHELGHGLHKDVLKNSVISIVQMVALVLIAWLTVRTESIYPDFGFAGRNYGLALILVLISEFPLLSPVFSIIAGAVSRRAEYRADAQAVKEGYGEALISGLKKLSRDNLADLAPSPIEVALTYSHPTLSQRISAIEKAMK